MLGQALLVRKGEWKLGSIQRSIYRKSTWTNQYLNFQSFCPIRYKQGLVRTLYTRAKKICTADCLNKELDKITTTLLEEGYPVGLTRKYQNDPEHKANTHILSKKLVYISLPFQRDSISFQISKKLMCNIAKYTIQQNYITTHLIVYPILDAVVVVT